MWRADKIMHFSRPLWNIYFDHKCRKLTVSDGTAILFTQNNKTSKMMDKNWTASSRLQRTAAAVQFLSISAGKSTRHGSH